MNYFLIVSVCGHHSIIKVPEKLRWRIVLKSLTKLAHAYNGKQKQMFIIEGVHKGQDGYENMVGIFSAKTTTRLPTFDLWGLENSKLVLLRERIS